MRNKCKDSLVGVAARYSALTVAGLMLLGVAPVIAADLPDTRRIERAGGAEQLLEREALPSLGRRDYRLSQSERQALIDLYNSTGGDTWKNNSGWKINGQFAPPGTECGWYGVSCSWVRLGKNQRILWGVGALKLSDNNLQGQLPASLASFQALHTFNVANNKLKGSLPDLRTASKLKEFNASNNIIGGDIAKANIVGHPSLEVFNIAYNRIQGRAPTPVSSKLMEKGQSQLCPNLIKPEENADWDKAAPRKSESEPYGTRWHSPTEWRYGIYPAWDDFGCRESLPEISSYKRFVDHAGYIWVAGSSDGSSVVPEFYYYKKFYRDIFIDVVYSSENIDFVLNRSVLVARFHSGGNDIGYVDPGEIYLLPKSGYVGGGVDVAYRFCLTYDGREPCTEVAELSLLDSPERVKQRITFDESAYGTVAAATTSGRLVRFTSSTPDICRLEDATWGIEQAVRVQAIRTGECRVSAHEGGTPVIAPAKATRAFQVVPGSRVQTITFPKQEVPLLQPIKQVGKITRPLEEELQEELRRNLVELKGIQGGASNNPVTLKSLTPSICAAGSRKVGGIGVRPPDGRPQPATPKRIVYGMLMRAEGVCVIAANQKGNDQYGDAPTEYQFIPIYAQEPTAQQQQLMNTRIEMLKRKHIPFYESEEPAGTVRSAVRL